ncbi:hypothetical protein C8R48DRAFT_679553 [Suillus tomentosus]|nr:hypothetical protein C8R48DRAFT_679553 [Suillus tomentosus]
MGEEFLSPMKPSSSYPPSNVFNNAIVASEASAAPGKTRLPLFVRFKTFVFDQSSVPKITSFAVKGVVPKSVVVQEQSTSPDVKKETVPIVASQAQNTPSGVKDNNDPSSVVVHAQDTPSRVDDSTKSQSAAVALQAAREDARKFKTLGGHAINVISAVRDGPADLDTASSFQDTYLQPLRIFDSAIRNIAEVWALLLHQDKANPIP